MLQFGCRAFLVPAWARCGCHISPGEVGEVVVLDCRSLLWRVLAFCGSHLPFRSSWVPLWLQRGFGAWTSLVESRNLPWLEGGRSIVGTASILCFKYLVQKQPSAIVASVGYIEESRLFEGKPLWSMRSLGSGRRHINRATTGADCLGARSLPSSDLGLLVRETHSRYSRATVSQVKNRRSPDAVAFFSCTWLFLLELLAAADRSHPRLGMPKTHQ